MHFSQGVCGSRWQLHLIEIEVMDRHEFGGRTRGIWQPAAYFHMPGFESFSVVQNRVEEKVCFLHRSYQWCGVIREGQRHEPATGEPTRNQHAGPRCPNSPVRVLEHVIAWLVAIGLHQNPGPGGSMEH